MFEADLIASGQRDLTVDSPKARWANIHQRGRGTRVTRIRQEQPDLSRANNSGFRSLIGNEPAPDNRLRGAHSAHST